MHWMRLGTLPARVSMTARLCDRSCGVLKRRFVSVESHVVVRVGREAR
jgi:hypothetical protein